MTVPERLYRWNHWYNQLPQEWRFQVILWPLIAVGFLNMLLTLAIRFPFGLLVLLGVMCVAAVRVPYAVGWIAPAAADRSGEPDARKFEIPDADWLVDVNRRYEAMPDARRFWVYPIVLLVAGAINMALTIGIGFPFGLLFLLALLALIAIRAPYSAGWLKSPTFVGTPFLSEQYSPRIAHAPSPMIPAELRSVEPEMLATPAPPAAEREMQTADPGEPVVPSPDVKPTPRAGLHDGVAVEPSMPETPARPVSQRKMRMAGLGEPAVPPVDAEMEPPAGLHDRVEAEPSPASEMPRGPAIEPDKWQAFDNPSTAPHDKSKGP